MELFTILILLLASLVVYKIFFSRKRGDGKDYFLKKGVKFEKQMSMLALLKLFTQKKSFPVILSDQYNAFPDEKIVGNFEFSKPIFMVRHPQLIKKLAIKDFDFFTDHRVVVTEEVDVLFGKSLISLLGQQWKDMRSTLSPAFTGHKMRLMFDFVASVGKQSVETLKRQIDAGHERDFDFKELAKKFTVDNIASCAFGIQVNSFSNPDNDFHRMASELTNNSGSKIMFKMLGFVLMPWIIKALNVKIFSEKVTKFFQETIIDTMRVREEKGIVRKDMIHLLMQAKKGKLVHEKEESAKEGFAAAEESQIDKTQSTKTWDDLDLAAQCFIFFVAGFETVATCAGFLAYELALNPDIQQKLHEEISETEQELDGKALTYERLQNMAYLDQVVSETLRKWPPTPVTDRICVKDYELEFDDKKFTIEKDKNFTIPIWALHRDPKYFPNPEKFDPSRFSDENKHNIQEYTFMPFGVGPRNCIGSRFALMEVKSIIYNILLSFSIVRTDKTPVPLEFSRMSVGLKAEKGLWVGLEPRKN